MPERTIGQVMQTHAHEAVDYARKRFRHELDFSGPSLGEVDRFLAVMYFDIPRTVGARLKARLTGRAPSDEEVWTLAKMWGGYAGEVLRRRWGGTWKSSLQPDGSVQISLDVAGVRCYPCDEIRRRLVDAAGDGAAGLYASVASQLGAPSPKG